MTSRLIPSLFSRQHVLKFLMAVILLLLLFATTASAGTVMRIRGWVTQNDGAAAFTQVIVECDGVRYDRIADAGGFYNFYLPLGTLPESCTLSVVANDAVAIVPAPGYALPFGTVVGQPAPGSVRLEQLRYATYWINFSVSQTVVAWTPWDQAEGAVIGYGRPTIDVPNPPDDHILREAAAVWYNWWYECSDDKQLPMAGYPAVISQIWGCNDGRPLLLLNEPDVAEQANLTPYQAAQAVKQVMDGGWHGEVYCCGTLSFDVDYMLSVIRAYESMYGTWPIRSYHIHAYAIAHNSDPSPTTFLTEGPQTVEQVQHYIDTLRANGYPVYNVIISEYGGLTRNNIDPKLMASLMLWQTEELRKIPEVRALLWFGAYYPRWWQNDLLQSDGSLTFLGKVWKVLADEYN